MLQHGSSTAADHMAVPPLIDMCIERHKPRGWSTLNGRCRAADSRAQRPFLCPARTQREWPSSRRRPNGTFMLSQSGVPPAKTPYSQVGSGTQGGGRKWRVRRALVAEKSRWGPHPPEGWCGMDVRPRRRRAGLRPAPSAYATRSCSFRAWRRRRSLCREGDAGSEGSRCGCSRRARSAPARWKFT